MPYRNAFARCTIALPDWSFCDAPTIPDAPVPICRKHAGRLMEFLTDRIAEDGEDYRATGHLLAATELGRSRYARPNRWARRGQGLSSGRPGASVYYAMIGGLVKIGTTINLAQRMGNYPPHTELLVSEPGSYPLERARHAQFAHLRVYEDYSEWFYFGRDLSEHVQGLRPMGEIA